MKKHLAKIITLVLVIAMCAIFFTACVPTDYAKAETKLKEAGFDVSVYKAGDSLMASFIGEILPIGDSDDVEAVVMAVSGEENGVYIIYFKEAKYAKANFKALKRSSDYEYNMTKYEHDAGERSDAEWEDFKAEHKTHKMSRNGKVLVFGMGAAYKAATK